MSGKKKKKPTSLFESIRKPTAPPSKLHGEKRPDERVDPVQRKAKHKKKIVQESDETDV